MRPREKPGGVARGDADVTIYDVLMRKGFSRGRERTRNFALVQVGECAGRIRGVRVARHTATRTLNVADTMACVKAARGGTKEKACCGMNIQTSSLVNGQIRGGPPTPSVINSRRNKCP